METYHPTIYTSLYASAAFISLMVTIIAVIRGRNRLVFPLAWLMVAVTWWCFCGIFESAAIHQDTKVFWSKLEYIGNVSVPVFFLLFALRFNKPDLKLRPGWIILLFVVPVVTLIFAFTNQYHGLIWKDYSSINPDTNLMEYHYGLWFWIGIVGYAYILLFWGTILLIRSVISLNKHYMGLMLLILLGLVLPWIGSLVYSLKINPIPGLDLSRIAFTITGMILLFAVLRLRLLDLSPIARELVIDSMPDGMIVVDVNNQVIDINKPAREILQLKHERCIGISITKILDKFPDLIEQITQKPSKDPSISSSFAPLETIEVGKYKIRISIMPLKTPMDRIMGRNIMLHDVTSLAATEEELIQRDRLLQATTEAITQLLLTENLEEAIMAALKTLGQAIQVDRVYIFENEILSDTGQLVTSQRHEWVSVDINPELNNPELQQIPFEVSIPHWLGPLSQGEVIKGLIREMPEPERPILEAQNIQSILVAPIFFRKRFWGFIGFDDCTNERMWSPLEEQILKTAAITLGTTYVKILTEKELITQKEKAEKSDKLKSAFLATMSHELRTPMNAIIGFSEIPDEDTTLEEFHSFNEIIHTSGKQLQAIIEDLFNISLIEAGEISLKEETFPIDRIVTNIEKTFKLEQKLASKEHLVFYLKEDPALANRSIKTDQTRLLQILDNLIRNAIKFTERGFVEFGFRMENATTIQFYVKDSGIGIHEEKQELIFEKFRQVDDSHTRKYGGTGLGLAIASNLSKLLGGTLTVASEPDKGALFSLTLPVLTGNIPDPVKEEETLLPTSFLNQKTILLAEDEESNYELIKTYFHKCDLTLLWVTNGIEAIDMLSMRPEIDLVLMDLKMPQMDGYEATKNIREQNPTIPVIALTAHAMQGDQEKTMELGFSEYIAKPVNKQKLIKLLKKILDR
jgi:signal transduction histidine kinase/CheY-like chemotaxis protein/PAS domain-containing protein